MAPTLVYVAPAELEEMRKHGINSLQELMLYSPYELEQHPVLMDVYYRATMAIMQREYEIRAGTLV